MTNLIVGDKDCSFKNVVRIITEKTPRYVEWTTLARSLLLSELDVLHIKMKHTMDTKGLEGRIYDILVHWRSQRSTEATLAFLIDALETRCGWSDIADALRNEFQKHPKQPILQKDIGKDISFYTSLEIGIGPSSIVYRGFIKPKNKNAAVKRIFSQRRRVIQQKVDIINREGVNKFIVELFSYVPVSQSGVIYTAMELGSSTLDAKIHSELRREQLVDILSNVSSGLKWLHDKNIVHGNLKPENVIIFNSPKAIHAKLSDFWFNRDVTVKEWMSPQELEACATGSEYECTKADDIYSLGLLFYLTMSRGERPPPLKPLIGPEQTTNHIIYWTLHAESSNRPTVFQISQHPIFWTRERCFAFLFDLGTLIDEDTNKDNVHWKRLDRAYQLNFHYHNRVEFHWASHLDERLFQDSPYEECNEADFMTKYKANSLTSLVTFIREKYLALMHNGSTFLLNDLFENEPEEIGYSFKNTFIKYFIEKFPDMVITTFCAVSTAEDASSHFATFQKEYVDGFMQYGKCWNDPLVSRYLSILRSM